MKTLPENVEAYRKTPVFDETTVPKALLNQHNTKEGVWGKINVLEGTLLYFIGDAPPETLTPERFGVVEPTVWHHIQPQGAVKFFVEFYR